jgi:tripartite-type tricarboxylate transporter receptor subunit TctC
MAATLAVGAASRIWAQATPSVDTFPNRPVRYVVPFPAGSVSDVQARPMAQKLSDEWRQQVIVENRPGATTIVAMEFAARSAPDGHTIVNATIAPLALLPHLMKLPFDPLKDFAAVTRVGSVPMLLVSRPDAPFDSVEQLVEHSRANPGRIKAAGYGVGSIVHLATVLLTQLTGADLSHVPYQGGPQQVADLLGGHVPLLWDFAGVLEPHLKAGRIKVLAVTSEKRMPMLPSVPTFGEQGYPGMQMSAWGGVMAPSGTPNEIVGELNRAIVKVLAQPDMRDMYSGQGVEIVGDSPAAFAAFIRAEHSRWGKIIRDAAIRLG